MKKIAMLITLFIMFPFIVFCSELQKAIDNAKEGAVILLDDGVYDGPVVINKALTIRGTGKKAYINGNGKGSVITVNAGYSVIENIHVSGSGESHESIDSCIYVKNADEVKILNNKIADCLFGINFEGSNRGLIENNNITSKNFSLGLRGDGIRLWYSHSNIIRKNTMDKIRDMVYWYSSANRIEYNKITDSRYSVHFMYADRNIVTGNYFKNNSVGVFFMYCSGSRLENNTITSASGAFGIGIGLKDASDTIISDNLIMYNGRGFYTDQSPNKPDTVNIIKRNKIYYNTTGIQLHGTILPSIYEDNIFLGNIDTIVNDTPNSKLHINRWNGNYWDEYEGFDRDKDGYGDIPFEYYVYTDRVMQYMPSVKFFYGSPVISVINFLSRLIPFSEPVIIAIDENPLIYLRYGNERENENKN